MPDPKPAQTPNNDVTVYAYSEGLMFPFARECYV